MESVLMALFGTTIFSTGVILQKKGSVWMNWNKKINSGFVMMFSVWLAGILLSYAVSTLFVGAASKSLPPQMVSALNAWSIVAIIFLSYFFLKEKLYASDIMYSAVIMACILIISRLETGEAVTAVNTRYLVWLLAAPFIILIPVFTKFTDTKQKTVLLSVFSGFLGGLTIVFMNILVKEAGSSLQGMLSSPHLYIYFFAGVVSVAAKQAAYRLGDVILITPLQTSFSMIYPFVCSYILFNANISSIQALVVLIIILSCWRIQKRR